MTEIRTVRLKQKTIEILDKIVKMKIKDAIENKTFDIDSLVKTKRGISYDKEVLFLARSYLFCIGAFNKLSSDEKRKSGIGKYLKELDRINTIC